MDWEMDKNGLIYILTHIEVKNNQMFNSRKDTIIMLFWYLSICTSSLRK